MRLQSLAHETTISRTRDWSLQRKKLTETRNIMIYTAKRLNYPLPTIMTIKDNFKLSIIVLIVVQKYFTTFYSQGNKEGLQTPLPRVRH